MSNTFNVQPNQFVSTGFLPGFAPNDFKNWKAPKATEVADGLDSNEAKKLDSILKNPVLGLSDEQIKAVEDFVETVANQTTATLGGVPDFDRLSKISCHDYKNLRGGRCEIALQQGSDAHKIRFGWNVVLKSELGEEAEKVQFGITCMRKVLGLTKSEMALIQGLNSWIKDSSVRWVRKQFTVAIKDGKSIREYSKEWRASFDFNKFQAAMQRILSAPDKFSQAYASDLARVRFAGRTISACKAAAYLLSVNLPVPHEIVRRVMTGERKLFRS